MDNAASATLPCCDWWGAIARTGEVDKAIAKFNRAKELDPELTLDAVARDNQRAEWG
ncbi:MAG: hypothetical protein WA885_17730 [Phormidesmis sp.]